MRGQRKPNPNNSSTSDATPVALTKVEALETIGVIDDARLSFVTTITDVVSVKAGRVLLRQGEFVRTTIIGVRGSVRVDDGGRELVLDGDFVIDDLALASGGAHSSVEVVAETPAQLILVNREHRDRLFHHLPGLRRRARATAEQIAAVPTPPRPIVPGAVGNDGAIDLTDPVEAPLGTGE